MTAYGEKDAPSKKGNVISTIKMELLCWHTIKSKNLLGRRQEEVRLKKWLHLINEPNTLGTMVYITYERRTSFSYLYERAMLIPSRVLCFFLNMTYAGLGAGHHYLLLPDQFFGSNHRASGKYRLV